MKVPPARAEAFLRDSAEDLRAVLLHGQDLGLVRERALTLLGKVLDDPKDPFRLVELTGAQISDDPARLYDEAASLSLVGGRRVVRVRNAGEAQSTIFAEFLALLPGEALVIVEAGDLGTRAKMVAAFESAGPEAAAIACYRDELRDLPRIIIQALAAEGLSLAPDALSYLTANLGGDRQLTRRELEKLVLYMGVQDGAAGETEAPRGRVELADAVACVGDSAALAIDDLALAVAGGAPQAADRALQRAFQEGTAAVTLLRGVARHFQRLHFVAGQAASGESADLAIKRLRPPIFWKTKEVFLAQAAIWPASWLGRALERMLEAEALCKTTGARERAICAEVLLSLAEKAPKPRTRRA